jgi:hypothetical protein
LVVVALGWAAWQWSTGVNVAPVVEGRIVDAETGLPVGGVLVFVDYTLEVTPIGGLLSLGFATTQEAGFQATRTMKDGSFRFERQHLPPWDRFGWRYVGPSLQWVHGDYGWGRFFEAARGVRGDLRIDRDSDQVSRLERRDPRAFEDACESATQPLTCVSIVEKSLATTEITLERL